MLMNAYLSFTLRLGKPVMIVTEYMENGSLDSFLRVSKKNIICIKFMCSYDIVYIYTHIYIHYTHIGK